MGNATGMVLGPVSLIDCLAFVVFLVPQLLRNVNWTILIWTVLKTLPFLLIRLPFGFISERYLTSKRNKTPFARQAEPFEDFVIRCVRYAFANMDRRVGRVFFSKWVAYPFLRFRMLRQGYLLSPIHYKEHNEKNFMGIWAIHDPVQKPDIVIYYIHGGGFMMGSAYFYLEFLLVWLTTLLQSGYRNPAIFALEYTLAPDGVFPTQLHEALHAYEHILDFADSKRVVFAGDSAGAAIALSLLLFLGMLPREQDSFLGRPPGARGGKPLGKPGAAALISPWVTLESARNRDTASDYLDKGTLVSYARGYAGDARNRLLAIDRRLLDAVLSPGTCEDLGWWRKACPEGGIFATYGEEEVFAPDITRWVEMLQGAGLDVEGRAEKAMIHAWPVVALFLSGSTTRRLRGLRSIVSHVGRWVPPHPTADGKKTGRRGKKGVIEDGDRCQLRLDQVKAGIDAASAG